MLKGKIVQVSGPVVDVEFEGGSLPYIKDALEVTSGGKRCVMEVAQHLDAQTARCIMLAGSEGLSRGMTVFSTGGCIEVPVGDRTLGRMFNVLGEPIDGGAPLADGPRRSIHREAPPFSEQSPAVQILETGIKIIDLLGGKSASSGAPAWERRC